MKLGAVLCRHARELRARLNQTAQVRAQLVSAVDALQRTARQEDATGVKQAIEAGQTCGGGLLEDVASAQQALQRWQLTTDNETKLAKTLSHGTSVLSLSRAIQVCLACAHNAQACNAHHAAWTLRQQTYSSTVTAWVFAQCCTANKRLCPLAWLDVRLAEGALKLLMPKLIEAVETNLSCTMMAH